jgi:hypothetical protein
MAGTTGLEPEQCRPTRQGRASSSPKWFCFQCAPEAAVQPIPARRRVSTAEVLHETGAACTPAAPPALALLPRPQVACFTAE